MNRREKKHTHTYTSVNDKWDKTGIYAFKKKCIKSIACFCIKFQCWYMYQTDDWKFKGMLNAQLVNQRTLERIRQKMRFNFYFNLRLKYR